MHCFAFLAESLAAIMCEENGFDEDYLQDLLEADDEFDEDREHDGGDDDGDGDDELVSIPLPTNAKLSSFGNDLICSFSRSVTSVASHLSIRSALSAARGAALPQSQQPLSLAIDADDESAPPPVGDALPDACTDDDKSSLSSPKQHVLLTKKLARILLHHRRLQQQKQMKRL